MVEKGLDSGTVPEAKAAGHDISLRMGREGERFPGRKACMLGVLICEAWKGQEVRQGRKEVGTSTESNLYYPGKQM